MPIFEYRCLSCSHEFELIVRPQTPPAACPACGSASVERQLSMFAVSSDGTTQRAREKLGAVQQQKTASVNKEREFYKTDHHDD
jgi:putative FmdB family regulatory protein